MILIGFIHTHMHSTALFGSWNTFVPTQQLHSVIFKRIYLRDGHVAERKKVRSLVAGDHLDRVDKNLHDESAEHEHA